MRLSTFRRLISRLRFEEHGTSLTEFTIFLPIWIVVFIGLINLGRVGIFSTKVQLQAQKELWEKSIAVTENWESAEHMTPIGAAAITAAAYGELAGMGDRNDQQVNDGIEAGATAIGMGIYGHYGESAEKSAIPLYPFLPDDVAGVYKPTDVLGQDDQSRYPHKILNDTIGDQDFGGGIASILTSVFAASGLVASIGAGIRYGSVFANKEETQDFIAGAGTITAGAHYDVLVAPRAINGAEAEIIPFGIAFLMFKADERYEKYQLFGKENWDGNAGSDTSMIPDWESDFDDSVDEGVEEECEERMANTSYDPDADDNDTGPDDTKPDWWDTCN